ncbi:hypothetical protein TMatcc_009826 [Talaromyces marneffei ATCC 18224]|nr:hypothetical protein EYB25_009786 [Talaromyces marneffei]
MSSRTATTARLLQQSHRSSVRILRPVRTRSSSSFSTCCPAWSGPLAMTTQPPSTLPPSQNRHYSSLPTSDTPTKPIFAEDVNPEQLSAPLQSLLEEKQWNLDEEGMGVAKMYYFKTYTKCLDFTQVVGIRSKSKNHHATITVKSGSVRIHWTTHVPRGLTQKDIDMAQYCDQQAALIGTVPQVDANKCKPAS